MLNIQTYYFKLDFHDDDDDDDDDDDVSQTTQTTLLSILFINAILLQGWHVEHYMNMYIGWNYDILGRYPFFFTTVPVHHVSDDTDFSASFKLMSGKNC